MNIDRITLGETFPKGFPVVIEIPMDHDPVKYEIDKATSTLWVDRLLATPMRYPCNYGFVPHTLGRDGDPLDVLVVTPYPLLATSVIHVRPLEVLIMEDESGWDEKIVALPTEKIAPELAHIQQIDAGLKSRITHFFSHYKDLDPGKWVKVVGFQDQSKAMDLLIEGVDRVKNEK